MLYHTQHTLHHLNTKDSVVKTDKDVECPGLKCDGGVKVP